MPINLIVLYNARHLKLAYVTAFDDELAYQKQVKLIYKQLSPQLKNAVVMRSLLLADTGVKALQTYDSYYQNFKFYDSLDNFEQSVTQVLTLTVEDIQTYLYQYFDFSVEKTQEVTEAIQRQLKLPMVTTNAQIPQCDFNAAQSNLLNKLLRQLNGYQIFLTINQIAKTY